MGKFFRYLALLLIANSVSILAFSQSTESGGSIVVPPSPNASSLMNQVKENVQLYTGSLSTQIPIFNLQSRDLSTSVSLNYNGSGHKVNDIASWVGLGWTLNAGGAITRYMRGIPDEFIGIMPLPSLSDAMNNTTTQLSAKGFLHPAVTGGVNADMNDFFFAASTTNQQRKDLINYSNKTGANSDVNSGNSPQVWDTEPDEFYFHFGGYSGKFVFDKFGDIKIIPHQNLTITEVITDAADLQSNSPAITSFVVTDPMGIKYYFGNSPVAEPSDLTAVETTFYSSFTQYVLCGNIFQQEFSNAYKWGATPFLITEGPNNTESILAAYLKNFQKFTSTWYLTKIQSQTSDEITFTYTADDDTKFIVSQNQDISEENYEYVTDELGTSRISIKDPINNWFEWGSNVGIRGWASARHQKQNISLSTTYNTIKSKRLSSITTSVGNKIEFHALGERADLTGGKELTEIIVYDLANAIIKKVNFNYEYKTQDPNNPDFHVFVFEKINGALSVVFETTLGPNEWVEDWGEMAGRDHFRMFLTSLTFSTGEYENEVYEFNYNHDQILPRRMSYKQDWYGYYNNNTVGHLIPKGHFTDPGGASNVFVFNMRQPGFAAIQDGILSPNEERDPNFARANRAPDPTRMQAGILTSILFPTGGKKEFIYDINKVGDTNAGGLAIKEIRNYPDSEEGYFESVNYSYSLGAFVRKPVAEDFDFQRRNWELYDRATVQLSSSSHVSSYLTKGSVIGYAMVEEFKNGLGKNVYLFKGPLKYKTPRREFFMKIKPHAQIVLNFRLAHGMIEIMKGEL